MRQQVTSTFFTFSRCKRTLHLPQTTWPTSIRVTTLRALPLGYPPTNWGSRIRTCDLVPQRNVVTQAFGQNSRFKEQNMWQQVVPRLGTASTELRPSLVNLSTDCSTGSVGFVYVPPTLPFAVRLGTATPVRALATLGSSYVVPTAFATKHCPTRIDGTLDHCSTN